MKITGKIVVEYSITALHSLLLCLLMIKLSFVNRNNAVYYSKLFRDRPLGAKDTINFWIEYVIRNGPESLRSPALDMHWWQLALLDVYGFLLSAIILTLVVVYYSSVFIVRRIFFKVKKVKTN